MAIEYVIRRFALSDSIACHRIRRSAFVSDFAAELPEAELKVGADAFSPEVFGDLLEGMETYVATYDGIVGGFCSIRVLARGEAEVMYLYLMPEARGKGLGTTLLNDTETAVIRAFPETRRLAVHTGVPNFNKGFWQQRGYVAVGTSFCRYPYGTLHALRLEKVIAEPPALTTAPANITVAK
jgi:GNAT superfamily N-acetyltransferase